MIPTRRGIIIGRARRLTAYGAPRSRRFITYSPFVGLKVLLCALALGTLLASAAYAQVAEGYIQLPDSFGPILPPYHVAVDCSPGAERLFIGSDSGDVIVIDAVNLRKLARIRTGPVTSLCYCPTENKLYAATVSIPYLVIVIDCSSYQVLKQLQLCGSANYVFYNPLVNRVYCGTADMEVIDCRSDSIVGTIPAAEPGCFVALDSYHNRLFTNGSGPLKVIDCNSDSVVDSTPNIGEVSALCYNPASRRVYATANQVHEMQVETLYAIDSNTDSIVSRTSMPWWLFSPEFYPTFALCVDSIHNRVYSDCSTYVACYDCALDTLTWSQPNYEKAAGIACAPSLDVVYAAIQPGVLLWSGETGDDRGFVMAQYNTAGPFYLQRVQRLYCPTSDGRLAIVRCGADSVEDVLPLAANAEVACLDTVDNRLYFANTIPYSYLGAVDCATRRVQSLQMCSYPDRTEMVHDARDDKMYVTTWNDWDNWHGDWNGISVYDCKTDSRVKVIPVGYVRGELQWDPTSDKVYGGANDSLGRDYVFVIDCATDSIVRTLRRSTVSDGFWHTLLSPELHQFWGFSSDGYTVVNCLKDSIVMDTVMENWWGQPEGVAYSSAEKEVYTDSKDLTIFSMESLRPVESVPLPPNPTGVLIDVPEAGKLLVARLTSDPAADSVYVLDTKTDSIVSRFNAGYIIQAMCVDATGRYVYCTSINDYPPGDQPLIVIDARGDSIVSEVNIPTIRGGLSAGQWLLANRRTGRLYACPGPDGWLTVIRDSVVGVGFAESGHAAKKPALLQTLVRRTVPLRLPVAASLYDKSGRRVVVLRPGPNDISRLAAGVYFVREEPQASSPKPPSVRKVVVVR